MTNATAISNEPAELVSQFFAALARRDLAGALDLLAPEAEWVAPSSLPYGGTFQGRRGVESYYKAFLRQVDDDFRLHSHELLPAPDGRVVVRGVLQAYGRLSGRLFRTPVLQLWSAERGQLTRLEYHTDTATILDSLEARAVQTRGG